MTRYIRFFIILTLPITALCAESASRSIRLLSLGGPIRDLVYEVQGKPIDLLISHTDFSQPYNAPASGVVNLYLKQPFTSPQSPADGKPEKQLAATATLPKNGSLDAYYMLVAPSADKSALRYRSFVIAADWNTQPIESVRVINFSSRRIAVKVDTASLDLTPGNTGIAHFPPKPSAAFKLMVGALTNDTWNLALSTYQPFQPNTRLLAFVYDHPNPENKDVRLRFITDGQTPSEEPKK